MRTQKRNSWTIMLLLAVFLLAACYCAEPTVTDEPTPSESRMLTRDELLAEMQRRQAVEDEQQRAAQAADYAAIDAKLTTHCAERIAGVRALVNQTQELMLKKRSMDEKYIIERVPLDRGFCAMVALSELDFIVVYDLEDRQLRTYLKPIRGIMEQARLYVPREGYFTYKGFAVDAPIQRSAVNKYFALWELEREKCRWRPCDE